MTDVNVPLLRKVVEWAEGEAARGISSDWIQDSWQTSPRTKSLTQATQILEENGDRFDFATSNSYREWHQRREQVAEVLRNTCGSAYCIAGYIVHQLEGVPDDRSEVMTHEDYMEIANRELGLPSGHTLLYAPSNNIYDVRAIAERHAGEKL